jgi:two-component system, chemotaxis family, protein-glutamate methylesterase/glutaminase
MQTEKRVRVLIVDDSVIVRKVLSDVLGSHPATEVAGTAASGDLALAKLEQLKPDVVTLDIEMPGRNGLETLAEIRKRYPRLPVIMFSTLTERGAKATLDALALGATDYATKPANTGSLVEAQDQIRRELIAKILGLRPVPLPRVTVATPCAPQRPPVRRRIDVLAIGTSTGGPNALAEVIPRLPKDFAVPVVLVQHMPALFTQLLSERLNANSELSVREGSSGELLQPGGVRVAPGGHHMTVSTKTGKASLELNQEPPENSCRPSVDVLFRSVAKAYGPHALAVVMTGMGSDGAQGAIDIHKAGGEVYVQDEASSVVWGMPGAVVAAGVADLICPLKNLATEIVRRVSQRQSFVTSGAR